MIELSKLEAFIYAAEHLNFSEAAKHLQLTQPTISHRIKILEQELGVSLFDQDRPHAHSDGSGAAAAALGA